MAKTFNARRLDVLAFAQANGHLHDQVSLYDLSRLAAELDPGSTHPMSAGANTEDSTESSGRWGRPVELELTGQTREVAGGEPQVWLKLRAQAELPLTCQRCLEPVAHVVDLALSYRFVADERTAELQDENADEDVLALSKALDAISLLEDELIMALPLVPRHDRCPTALGAAVVPPPHEEKGLPKVAGPTSGAETRQRPFAGLKDLVSSKARSGL